MKVVGCFDVVDWASRERKSCGLDTTQTIWLAGRSERKERSTAVTSSFLSPLSPHLSLGLTEWRQSRHFYQSESPPLMQYLSAQCWVVKAGPLPPTSACSSSLLILLHYQNNY